MKLKFLGEFLMALTVKPKVNITCQNCMKSTYYIMSYDEILLGIDKFVKFCKMSQFFG